MAFDWLRFLDAHAIPYVTSGQKVRKDNVGIMCPFCPPSEHLDYMGISLTGRGWHCWRDDGHSGKAPHRLVAVLLGCSREEAARIVASDEVAIATSDESFADDMFRRLGRVLATPRYHAGDLKPLPEFVPLGVGERSRMLAFPYLARRGYDWDAALRLASRYGLMFAPSGRFAYRIIMPVVVNRILVNWTGRTVAESEPLRYKSLCADPERAALQSLPVARTNIKDTLFDHDDVSRGGETLVVCEGPFDAMRVGSFGERRGIRATCLFGKSASAAQLDLLAGIADRFDRRVVLFDRDADLDVFAQFPDYLRFGTLKLPEGVKDPGELSSEGFAKVFDIQG